MEAFHCALLDVIEVAHPNMMSFVQDLWQVASLADRDSALCAAGTARLLRFSGTFNFYSCSKCETSLWL